MTIAALAHGQPLYMVALRRLIVFFCFFYTAIVFNPEETADNLNKSRRLHSGHSSGQEHGRTISTMC